MKFWTSLCALGVFAVGCGSNEAPVVQPVVDSAAEVDSTLPPVDSAIDDSTIGADTEIPDVDDTAVVETSDAADASDAGEASDASDAPDATDVLDASDTYETTPLPSCAFDAAAEAESSVADVESDAELDADADAESDAAGDAVVDSIADTDALPVCVPTRVRIAAANLTSGNYQRYEGPGIRILQGLKPDIVLLQEMNYLGTLRDFVDTTFGSTFSYMVETGTGIPNGVVSRYPIIASGEWDDPDLTDRDFAWARIDVPGPVDLWAVSVHFRTASATARDTEARKLVEYVKANVPPGSFLVVGGDLNTDNELEPALTTLGAIVVTTAPYAVDQAGNNKTNATRTKSYDWLMPEPLLGGRMIPVRIGGLEFPNGLVFDTRVYSPLADVTPALATDSAAMSMQHMVVVRDFVLFGR